MEIDSVTVGNKFYPITFTTYVDNGIKIWNFFTLVNGKEHELSSKVTQEVEETLSLVSNNPISELEDLLRTEMRLEIFSIENNISIREIGDKILKNPEMVDIDEILKTFVSLQ